MVKISHMIVACMYNLALLAGFAYLIVEHDLSPWSLIVALILAASWDNKPRVEIETGK